MDSRLRGNDNVFRVHLGVIPTQVGIHVDEGKKFKELICTYFKVTIMEEESKFFEDFEIGETTMTPARTITETDIMMHAMHSGDWMPHHSDVEFCKEQPFKKPIMHGNGTFAISTGLSFRAEKLNPNAMSYGYNKIRYPGNVYAGDTIRVETKVIDKKDHPKRPGHGLITEAKTTYNQRDEVVCYAEHILYVNKRSA